MSRVGVPLRLDRWIPVRDVRRLIWCRLNAHDRELVRCAHNSKHAPHFADRTGAYHYWTSRGYIDLLEWMPMCYEWLHMACSIVAAQHNQVAVLEWLHNGNYCIDETSTLAAVQRGRLEAFCLLFYTYHVGAGSSLLAAAIQAGSIPILEHILVHGLDYTFSVKSVIKIAVWYECISVLEWLYQRTESIRAFMTEKRVCCLAIRAGHLSVLHWARRAGIPLTEASRLIAFQYQRHEILAWLSGPQ